MITIVEAVLKERPELAAHYHRDRLAELLAEFLTQLEINAKIASKEQGDINT